MLSQRGHKLCTNSTSNRGKQYFASQGKCPYFAYVSNEYDRITNTGGIVCLAYAENKLVFDLWEPHLNNYYITEKSVQYTLSYGSPQLLNTFVSIFQHLGNIDNLSKDNILLGSGCNSLIRSLLYCTLNKNDVIIIEKPCYYAYIAMLEALDIQYVFVDNLEGFNIANYQALIDAHGSDIKAILISNPSNPTGKFLNVENVQELCNLAKANNLHVISDEIFGFDVFQKEEDFCSLVTCTDYDNIHVVYGTGKIGIAGLKIAGVYTRNGDIRKAMKKMVSYSQISSITQQLVSKTIDNEEFFTSFISENRNRILKSYTNCKYLLEKYHIPYQEAYAGLTILIDLRDLTHVYTEKNSDDHPFRGERELFDELIHKHGVFLSPGEDFFFDEPGWFRLTFTEDQHAVEVCLERLEKFIEMSENQDTVVKSILHRMHDMWNISDIVFKQLFIPEDLYINPIELRFPYIFYLGHLASFYMLQASSVTGFANFCKELDDFYARGKDPDIETGKCHDTSVDMNNKLWHNYEEIFEYSGKVREVAPSLIRSVLNGDQNNILIQNERVLELILEHDMMHLETLLYMTHCFDINRFIVGDHLKYHAPTHGSTHTPEEFVLVQANDSLEMGVDFDDIKFGWDNEFPKVVRSTSNFYMATHNVTIGEYLEFVESGDYNDPTFWTKNDYEWKLKEQMNCPINFIYNETTNSYRYRSIFETLPIETVKNWPASVSQAEANAYCKWKGGRLPTEEEWNQAALHQPDPDEEGKFYRREYPWGDEPPCKDHGNFDFQMWHPCDVGSYDNASYWGIYDLVGNGWEWTSSYFRGFEGFEAYIETYPGYSADFFDDKHFVVKGGSWATHRQLLRKSFRNWYQGHYPYVFSSFRIVKDAL
eukprot:TRINITY_DN3616_c0_g1_i1.p1 TRINITY_DN3616_c0_g1~~TRINITY_DN3616_c0_g1_i1.p1  ORF type:complete len:878 (-),score=166.87 TRINITY_DN3616_c0_g1_i1:900-3533(-)